LIIKLNSFLNNCNLADYKSFLLYGNNIGKVEYYYDKIMSSLSSNDYKKILFDSDDIHKEKLLETIEKHNHMNLFNEKFALVISPKNNSINNELLKLISGHKSLNFIIILKFTRLERSSTLRKFFESSKNHIIIPCYENTNIEIIQIIKEQASLFGLNLGETKISNICEILGNSDIDIRKELEKIFILEKKNLGHLLNTRQNYYEDTSFLFNLVSGKPLISSEFNRYTDFGKNRIRLVNNLIEHFFRLFTVKNLIKEGETAFNALRELKPPIFFKFEKRFLAHVSQWDTPRIKATLKELFFIQRMFLDGSLSSESRLEKVLLDFSSDS